MAKHALLSASASHRWLACPPSARLCAGLEDEGNPYAQQGTDAHSLCQHLVETALGRHTRDPTADLTFYDAEMQACAEAYRDFTMDAVAAARRVCGDPLVLIEQKVDYSSWVPEGYGYCDCLIVCDAYIHVIDFKYGSLVVPAERNPQLMCYALGGIDTFGCLYDIRTVRLSIFQPRREHFDTYEMLLGELLTWADGVLAPAAKLAYAGEGEFNAGEHCWFCKAKDSCPKRGEYRLELAKHDFELADLEESKTDKPLSAAENFDERQEQKNG